MLMQIINNTPKKIIYQIERENYITQKYSFNQPKPIDKNQIKSNRESANIFMKDLFEDIKKFRSSTIEEEDERSEEEEELNISDNKVDSDDQIDIEDNFYVKFRKLGRRISKRNF